MSYKKFFDPPLIQSLVGDISSGTYFHAGDSRDGRVYVYAEKIILAINVALATSRPLLIRGPSGSGKSSLGHSVARYMGWRYYEEVISSRTQARDLLWRFDSLQRLNDAQAKVLHKDQAAYLEPGILWWAFDRESAFRRGRSSITEDYVAVIEPGDGVDHERAVVLVDEIDKADPDVPNDLLVPLGSGQFIVQETGIEVRATHPPLVFITTNEERTLPSAFMRRCVILVLDPPNESRLVEIAKAHFGDANLSLLESIANYVMKLAQKDHGIEQAAPSAAEYLDTVHACLELGVRPDSKDEIWKSLSQITLSKPRNPPGGV